MSEPEPGGADTPEPDLPTGTVKPTPVRSLVVAAVFGGLGGWLVEATPRALGGDSPQVPWTAPIVLLAVAAGVGVLARSTFVRIQRRHERVESQQAVTLLVLGKASAMAGAVIAGGYLVFGLLYVSSMDAVLPRERVIRSAVAMLAGVGLAVGGLLLERACRVPEPPHDTLDESG